MGHVDATYPLYAGSDPVFYDKPRVNAAAAVDHFTLLNDATGVRADDETWSYWMPEEVVLPEQGWKIHVSATPATADAALQLVSRYCHRTRLPFKFLRHRKVLDATLAKDGDRRLSGKFITIYPTSPAELESHLNELDAALKGMPGPYVLTDLRWKQGPVFVRYGAFTRLIVNDNGLDVPAIRDLDTGHLVPDVRATAFHIPPWIQIPEFLQAELDQLDMTPPLGFPAVRGALHFSNAGGVYEAELDGRPVILKEARPHVGWTPDGRDAVQRLHDEAALLTTLHGAVPLPAVLKIYDAHGHSYLAMERIDAVSLNAAVASRNPLVTSHPTRRERRAYRHWAGAVTRSLREAVAALHNSGRVHGDLHPANVLVRDDRTVVLIDLEMSRPVDAPTTGRIGAPGYIAPDDRNGIEQDLYALACIELFMFVPLIPLLNLSAVKAEQLVGEAATRFELEDSWTGHQLARLSRTNAADADTANAADGPDLVAAIARTLLTDATPGRSDRLWPGDPAQFTQPATSLAHGALGVLMVLQRAGVKAPSDVTHWAERAEPEGGASVPRRLGLLDGLAGTVWAYRGMGVHELADRRFRELITNQHATVGSDLYGGLPGLGLTMLHEAESQPTMRDAAIAIAANLRERWLRLEPPSRVATGAGGLMHGATGTALFALRLYETTGDRDHLQIATEAMDFDLHSLAAAPDGSLQVDEGWRLLPYLGSGSAGIGIVLTQLLTHLPGHSRYIETLEGIARAATAPFTAQSGLFEGRAGLIQFLLTLAGTEHATNEVSAALREHVAALELHALHHGDQIRFAGNGMLRASCDLATGAAGVLGTLIDYSAQIAWPRRDSTCLPFLTPAAHLTPRRSRRPDPYEGGEMNGLSPVTTGA